RRFSPHDPLADAAVALLRRIPWLGPAVPLDTLESALDAAVAEAARGIGCTLAFLGGDPGDPDAVVVRPYAAAAQALAARGLCGEFAVKLSLLGLQTDPVRCEVRLRAILASAAAHGARVWIDMEGPDAAEPALALVRHLVTEGLALGTGVQANLRRTASDVDALIAVGAAVRLVKGSYHPSRAAAFRSRREVAESFFRLGTRLVGAEARDAGVRAVFATHDLTLLGRLQDHAWSRGLGRDAFEWHALRGVRAAHQERLARQGYPVRAVISYGEGWLGWYARRLAARPANLWLLARGVIG
ncbi:MAG: proline dehydrogenase family protein, partial [Gemmatimonadota bacterium]